MQEADAARKRLMRASSCVSANADARALPFMIMQRVCGNVDGASRFRPAIFRRAAHMALEEFATVTNVGRPLAAALGSIGPFSSDRLAREVEQAVAVVPVLRPACLNLGRDTVGERFH